MTELAIARGDGRYAKQLARVAKIDLLVSDDWGMPPWNEEPNARIALVRICEG